MFHVERLGRALIVTYVPHGTNESDRSDLILIEVRGLMRGAFGPDVPRGTLTRGHRFSSRPLARFPKRQRGQLFSGGGGNAWSFPCAHQQESSQ
jgi:hypothetical protein